MRFGTLTALTGVVILALAVFYGCSDDKTTSTPTVTYGSIDDPVFVPVKVQIDEVLTTFIGDILSGFDNLQVYPGDTSTVQAHLTPPWVVPDPEASPETLYTIYQNGWHFVYATYVGNSYHSRLRDSIQYRIDGTPIEGPSIDVDFIHFINNWTFTSLNPDVTHNDYTGRNDFQIANLDQVTAVINGTTANTVEAVFVGNDSTMTNIFSFTATITDIRVSRLFNEWRTGCPSSGAMQMTMSHTYIWDNTITFGTGADSWVINVVFNEGSATVTAGNGDETWQYVNQVCTAPSN